MSSFLFLSEMAGGSSLPAVTYTIGRVSETDTVSAVASTGPVLIRQVVETSTALPVASSTTPAITPAPIRDIHRRNSMFWADPVLDAKGRPVGWGRYAYVIEDWGSVMVAIDGVNVTYYRDVPAILHGWQSDEPFGFASASISFPQITPFETLPSWLHDRAAVDIILYNGEYFKLWEGYVSAEGDSFTNRENSGVLVECKGALFQLDDYLAKPAIVAGATEDLGVTIQRFMGPQMAPGVQVAQMPLQLTNIRNNKTAGSWNPILTGFIQELLSTATSDDDNGYGQWTIHSLAGRVARLTGKDRTTVDWTVVCGQPGVTHDLTRDFANAANVYYGEGIDASNCRWRNTFYPNERPDGTPVFDGVNMGPGYGGFQFLVFEQEAFRLGYNFAQDGFYDPAEVDLVMGLQYNFGIEIDGVVGAQTWAALFQPGAEGGDLTSAYFFPLSFSQKAVPFYPGGQGSQVNANPDYDPTFPRRERYQNFGDHIEKADGIRSSFGSNVKSQTPDYMGTITLSADPQEGHRFQIVAGHNILYKFHRGGHTMFHIASVDTNYENGTVTCTVDQNGQDALSLAERIKRNRENFLPSWKQEYKYRNSHVVEDNVSVFDCENGNGRIPYHAIQPGLWNVLHIPTSSGGSISRLELSTAVPTRLVCGIFDRPITPNELSVFGAPLDVDSYWDNFGDGLVIAWGDSQQAAGFYPGSESSGDSPTGVLIDNATWYYESQWPPWLWVALWVQGAGEDELDLSTNFISGRLFPAKF